MKLIAPLVLPALALAAPAVSETAPASWKSVAGEDVLANSGTSCPPLTEDHVTKEGFNHGNYQVVYTRKENDSNPEKPKMVAHVVPVACNEQINEENAEEAYKQHEKKKALAKKAKAKAEKLSEKADAKASKAAKKAQEKKDKNDLKAVAQAEKEVKKAKKQKEKADKLAQKAEDKAEKDAAKADKLAAKEDKLAQKEADKANKGKGKKPAGKKPSADEGAGGEVAQRRRRNVPAPEGSDSPNFKVKVSMVMKFSCKKDSWSAVRDAPLFDCSAEPIKEVAELLEDLDKLEAEMDMEDDMEMSMGSGDKDSDDESSGDSDDSDDGEMEVEGAPKIPMEEPAGEEVEPKAPSEGDNMDEEHSAPPAEEKPMDAVHESMCDKMMSHWDPVLATCVKNECHCDNGLGADPCPHQGEAKCGECNPGFELQSDFTCVESVPEPEATVEPVEEEVVTGAPKVVGKQVGVKKWNKANNQSKGKGGKKGKKGKKRGGKKSH